MLTRPLLSKGFEGSIVAYTTVKHSYMENRKSHIDENVCVLPDSLQRHAHNGFSKLERQTGSREKARNPGHLSLRDFKRKEKSKNRNPYGTNAYDRTWLPEQSYHNWEQKPARAGSG
jgi:hypothetical protein